MKRFLATFLALAMLLAMVGCTEQKAQPTTTTPETTVPGAEQFAQSYSDAATSLEALGAVTLDVKQSQSMQVEDQLFVTEREQVVAYSGLGSDAVQIRMEENVKYSADEDEEEEDATSLYTEIYADGTMFVELEDTATFQGSLSSEEATLRYVPAVLLNPALYGEITMDTVDGLQKVSFAAPSAPEAWAVPAEAQLLDASGFAEITAEGAVVRMQYTVTYQYGTMEITREVETTPRTEAMEVAVPEDADSYTQLEYAQALYAVLASENLMENAETAFADRSETYISHAGAVQYSTGKTMYMHGQDKDMVAKLDTHISVFTSAGSQSYEEEQTYQNGKLTIVVDNGLPTTQTGVKASEIRETALEELDTSVAPPEYWQEVTLTEVGGKYLMEFTYTDDFGNNMQNTVCTLLFQDPTLLNQLATAYENKEVTGYLSLEKYTGLAIASGLYYEGAHTIEGNEYLLSLQSDSTYEVPSYGAYHEITDQYPEDSEPENKATPLFYKVTGADGQQMWLLGTIHIGDDRTAYLPQEIYDAVAASDAIALEINSDSAEERIENDEKLQAALTKDWYYEKDTIADHLDEELYNLAVQHMKAAGTYHSTMDYLKIGLWYSMLEQQSIRLGHTLRYEQGVEDRLIKLSKEKEIPIWEVEDFVEHTNLLINWSEELQILLLEDTMEMDIQEYLQETQELYELWCTGDEAALREMINEETDTSEFTEEELAEYEEAKPLIEEYNKAMSYDRNEQMLKVAKEYLESGDVVFFAVGLAHLLDNTNGLVDALRAAGYTVEIVTYK